MVIIKYVLTKLHSHHFDRLGHVFNCLFSITVYFFSIAACFMTDILDSFEKQTKQFA